VNELRLILLVAGLLFIAGIAGFEWWRARRNRPANVARVEETGATESSPQAGRAASLPEINVVREPRVAVDEDLPVIELASTSASGTRRALGISISDDVATDTLRDTQRAAAPTAASPAPAEPARPAPPRSEPYISPHIDNGFDEISEVRIVIDDKPVRGPQLVLAWPREAERRIVTLRVIPGTEPRFAGRTLRQAFASAGFWHGPLDIYHLPDDAGRVVVSAAALAQPGTFDPSIMDSQRFSGLNLFTVLPGPMSERDAFDALVGAARVLAERLEGAITDQHGEELTQARIHRLRQSLPEPVQARAAGES
jgi:cell division protein ZipA